MAKRQTVWLSTMMILSLMVIGYYTVDNTLQPVPVTSPNEQSTKDLTQKEQPKNDQMQPKSDQQAADKQTSAATDWFYSQFVKQDQNYSAEVEKLQKVIADTNTSTEKKAEAQKQMQELTDFYEKADKVADKIMAEGYEEALVTKDGNRITVTVMAQELSKEQVAKIYSLVGKELSVSASQITVTYRK